ncbi:Solute carrier organic anion transporter family member, partial [Gryllus bimaculatus]
MPLVLIFLSQFVLGVGTTLYYALGQTYLDDNTNKRRTPLMLGCVLALRTIGPAFGFILGFACLRIYIAPSLTPLIDKDDPRWLGAWWLGWMILGCLKLTVALLISLFPRELPKRHQKEHENNHICEEQPLKSPSSHEASFTPTSKVENESSLSAGFFPALKRLLGNKLLMCNNLSTVFYILGASGYITFVMKYMETQFQQAASSATGFAGCIAISAMVIGFLVSGIIISKYKPRTLYILSWNVLAGLCYFVCEIIFMFLSCPNNNPNLKNSNGQFELLQDCNADCGCSNKYSPICDGETGSTYYSPCFAGCTVTRTLNSSQVFTNCACITEARDSAPFQNSISDRYLLPGACSSDCAGIFYSFLAIQFFMHFLGNTGKIGNILITYRCVKVEDKSFAQGLTLFMISLLAFIPGPIIYGVII